jgi:peptidoglycan hydrolase-like protein with peptidoglycan-binding domain
MHASGLNAMFFRSPLRGGYTGLGDFATVGGTLGQIDVAALQRALNAKYPYAATPLVVDGKLGPKTRARIQEFKVFLGYFPADSVIDTFLITALGLSTVNPAVIGAVQGAGSAMVNFPSSVPPSPLPPTLGQSAIAATQPQSKSLADTLGVSKGTLQIGALALGTVVVLAVIKGAR